MSARRISSEQVATLETVTQEDISASGARTLDEALRLLPGVYVSVGGQGTPRIQIRGLQVRSIKLLVNGIPVNSTYESDFDPTQIPVTQIDRIKVSKGASSVLYGDGGLGGVINIITRRGQGAPALTGAGVEAGTSGYRRAWASTGGSSGDFDFSLSANHQSRDGYRLSSDFSPNDRQGKGRRINSDLDRSNLYLNLGYRLDSDWQLGFNLNAMTGKQGIPPVIYDNSVDRYASRTRYERLTNQKSLAMQWIAAWQPADSPWSARFWFYDNQQSENSNSYDDASYSSMSDPALNNTYALRNRTHTPGAHAEVRYDFARLGNLTFATDIRRDNWSSHGVMHDLAVSGGGGGGGSHPGPGGAARPPVRRNLPARRRLQQAAAPTLLRALHLGIPFRGVRGTMAAAGRDTGQPELSGGGPGQGVRVPAHDGIYTQRRNRRTHGHRQAFGT
ncbi:hypothetical protein E2I20_00010 [Alcaligenaceae bacterium SAGV3]|nr:hypothetical protein [Alcaligenaceae bacterium SAGV3]